MSLDVYVPRCDDCGAMSGDTETLDDGAVVEVQIRWRANVKGVLCVTCYLDACEKRGPLPQFGELK